MRSPLFFAGYVILALLVGCEPKKEVKGFLRVDGQKIVDEKGNNVLLRGMGLGGWMLQEGYMLRVEKIGQQQHVIRGKITELIGEERTNQFYDAWLTNHTRKIDIDSMARWGFNSVRLAMHYNLYTLPVDQEPVAGKDTWIDKGFTMTDSLLNWCKANNLYLILDLHAAPGGQGNDLNISDRDPSKPSLWDSEENQRKTVALWRKLAERYANEPWIAAYDLINEPNWGFENADDRNGCNETKNEPLKKLMIDITKVIREVDQNHIIIIEGNCWGNNYNGVFPLWDKNFVVSFHKYWSFNDTATIRTHLKIREQYNVPIWLGESGENSNLWYRDALHLMESNNIGWAWWPLKKLGHNNPLQVKTDPDYQKVIDYWAERGPKPAQQEAYNGLMAFAENLKLENCTVQRDVIDAMFRQVQTHETQPFKKHTDGMFISAADYDLGRNGYAYFDHDTANYWVSGRDGVGNRGHVYRNDGVDIRGHADDLSSLIVDHIETGEWMQYTIDVTSDGIYVPIISLINLGDHMPGSIEFTVVGKEQIGTVYPMPPSAGKLLKVNGEPLDLKKGIHKFRVSGSLIELKGFELRKQ
jgi:aryl-phospho-beta-D-glucosidase BglC (GH1 family)